MSLKKTKTATISNKGSEILGLSNNHLAISDRDKIALIDLDSLKTIAEPELEGIINNKHGAADDTNFYHCRYNKGTVTVFAIAFADGAIAWTHTLPLATPLTYSPSIRMATTENSIYISFDKFSFLLKTIDGTLLAYKELAKSIWGLVADKGFYYIRYMNGVYQFDSELNQQLIVEQEPREMAAANGMIYCYMESEDYHAIFYLIEAASGKILKTVNLEYGLTSVGGIYPVPGHPNHIIVILGYGLIATRIDLDSKEQIWTTVFNSMYDFEDGFVPIDVHVTDWSISFYTSSIGRDEELYFLCDIETGLEFYGFENLSSSYFTQFYTSWGDKLVEVGSGIINIYEKEGSLEPLEYGAYVMKYEKN